MNTKKKKINTFPNYSSSYNKYKQNKYYKLKTNVVRLD